jgi:hypothetical protein
VILPILRALHPARYNRSPLGERLLDRQQRRQVARWERAGRPPPPPDLVKHAIIRDYAAQFQLRTLVETGTFVGDTPAALCHDFDRIYTIELDPRLARAARRRFTHQPHITVIRGDSSQVLHDLVPFIDEPVLFWLDGHWSGGVTARGAEISPILRELATVLMRDVASEDRTDVLLIDDARLFGTRGYPSMPALYAAIQSRRPAWDVYLEHDIIRGHAPRNHT